MSGTISLSFLLPGQTISPIRDLRTGFTRWQKATAVFSVSQTMRQMEIYPSWNGKDMPMMDSPRMNIPIMDYGSSGMEVMCHE